MKNVVLLTIDSLRADHCSCYGYERETTPNLDTFAENAVRFENAYSPSSHTREAMPALLTGRYPHAAVDENYHLAQPTLATMLTDTHHTGAFHSNPFLSRAYGYDRDFDVFDDDLYLSRHKLVALAQRLWDKIRGHHYARAETINERSLSWLDSLPDDEPFFLWNHYMDVHGPYEPPEPYRSEFAEGSVDDERAQQLWRRAVDSSEEFTPDERRLFVDFYDGEVLYTDDKVGNFLDALFDRYSREDTLVIVTSDHGDLLGEDSRYSHPRELAPELLRVPLFVDGPGTSASAVNAPVGTLNIAATVLGTLDMGRNIDGLSLLSEATVFEDRIVVCEARGDNDRSHVRQYRAFGRTGSRECVLPEGESAAIEGDDLLARRLEEHIESVPMVDRDASATVDIDVDARLEALGYK